MGWTLATTRGQPFEDLALIVADHLMEAEDPPDPPPATSQGPQPGAPGRKRVTRTTTYQAA